MAHSHSLFLFFLPITFFCWFVQCVGGLAKGVRVAELVEGGNAATCGTAIGAGDELVAVTAVRVGGLREEWQAKSEKLGA
jgi:hypothetical protein